jgi:hypothetical protein
VLVLCVCDCSFANLENDLIDTVKHLKYLAKTVKHEIIIVRNKVEKNLQDLKCKEFDWLQHYFGLKRKIAKENKVLKEAERKVEEMIKKLKDI